MGCFSMASSKRRHCFISRIVVFAFILVTFSFFPDVASLLFAPCVAGRVFAATTAAAHTPISVFAVLVVLAITFVCIIVVLVFDDLCVLVHLQCSDPEHLCRCNSGFLFCSFAVVDKVEGELVEVEQSHCCID